MTEPHDFDQDEAQLPGIAEPDRLQGDNEAAARRTIRALSSAQLVNEQHAVMCEALLTAARQLDRAASSSRSKDYGVANLLAQLRETYVVLVPDVVEGGDRDPFEAVPRRAGRRAPARRRCSRPRGTLTGPTRAPRSRSSRARSARPSSPGRGTSPTSRPSDVPTAPTSTRPSSSRCPGRPGRRRSFTRWVCTAPRSSASTSTTPRRPARTPATAGPTWSRASASLRRGRRTGILRLPPRRRRVCPLPRQDGPGFHAFAPVENCLHGSTPATVVLDEAFAHSPSQGRHAHGRDQPGPADHPGQAVWIVSTAGTAESTFLHDWIAAGERADPRVALFLWAAPTTRRPTPLEAIEAYHPGVGFRLNEVTLTAEDVLGEQAKNSPAEYVRAFGNRRTLTSANLIPVDDWTRLADLSLAPPSDTRDLTLSYDVAADRRGGAIVATWNLPDGRVAGKVVQASPGTSWLATAVDGLVRAWRPADLAAPGHGPVLDVTAQLRDLGHNPTTVAGQDFAAHQLRAPRPHRGQAPGPRRRRRPRRISDRPRRPTRRPRRPRPLPPALRRRLLSSHRPRHRRLDRRAPARPNQARHRVRLIAGGVSPSDFPTGPPFSTRGCVAGVPHEAGPGGDHCLPRPLGDPSTFPIATPWGSTGNLEQVFYQDVFGTDGPPINTRRAAMAIPAIARARNLLCNAVAKQPLKSPTPTACSRPRSSPPGSTAPTASPRVSRSSGPSTT
jgi:hypothetical protein